MTDIDINDINLDDIPDGPPTIPAADYHMKIVQCDAKETNNPDPETGRKGTYLNYRAVVQSGEQAGESVFGMWSLKPKQLWQLKRDLKRLGFDDVRGSAQEIAKMVEGAEGYARVKESVRRDRDTKQPDPSLGKENSIAQWIGTL